MTRGFICGLAVALLAADFGSVTLRADTTTWNAAAGNWTNDACWDHGAPRDGDAVVIESGTVLLTNPSAFLPSFTLTGGTLVFSNWTTRLTAVNILLSGGTVTLPVAFTESQMSNRVWFVCSNDFMLGTKAAIDVSGRGYARQNGPGKGASKSGYGCGGSYGGLGGYFGASGGGDLAGPTYGSYADPTDPGSGGGGNSVGGAGGGAVRIEAPQGTVTVNGKIYANGQNASGSHGGGGSGGAIYIRCRTLAGSAGGLLQAAAGDVSGGATHGGGGGGGRIAVVYDPVYQAGGVNPGVRMTTHGAGRAGTGLDGYNGTLFLPDLAFCPQPFVAPVFSQVNLYIGGPQEWVLNSLTVSNAYATFAGKGFHITVSNDVTIGPAAVFGLGPHAILDCGGNLTLTNGGALWVCSGATNGIGVDYGALVSVTGRVIVASNSWIYPQSDGGDGGSPLFRCGSLDIAAGGGFQATGLGFGRHRGYGRPLAGSGGAGYGGRGAPLAGSRTYCTSNAPIAPGSGGGTATSGGRGGGLIRIECDGAVHLNGTLDACGTSGIFTYGGGGSGGGIFVRAKSFSGGSAGVMRARAGKGHGLYAGGGGGGRITVWENISTNLMQLYRAGGYKSMVVSNRLATFQGSVSVAGGGKGGARGDDGEDGTIYFFSRALSGPGIMFVLF